ncbi:ROK family transcriptional regulator [Actinomyces sp. zg328]|uniref:ROK family transcriptional regulator n=1 Tax=Actinomyces sp. zg328 TaxID=2609287 RepID=UPI0013582192|nr:ROK family transcriptional regulator [Actinomyces sp. zg328]
MEATAAAGPASRVLLRLAAAGPRTRTDLADHLGLSAPTLSRAVRPLIEDGLLLEDEPSAPTAAEAGRPAKRLRLAPRAAALLGIKLTAKDLYAQVIDPLGSPLVEVSEPLAARDPDGVVEQIAGLSRRIERSTGMALSGIGLSLGASVVDGTTIAVAPFLGWRDEPIGERLREATGLDAIVANDVRAFTHAEAWFGLGHGVDPFALLTIGAGIGCGLVIGGRTIAGAHGAAGSIGHLPLREEGPACEMGHVGCARALAAAPGIAHQASEVLGHHVSPEEIVGPAGLTELARDPQLAGVLEAASDAAGRIVGSIVALVDPELVVVSGESVGLVEAHRQVFDAAVERSRHWSAPPPRILTRSFSFGEWARGAAALAIEPWTRAVEAGLRGSSA